MSAETVMMSMQVAADYKHRDFKVRGADSERPDHCRKLACS
jgi:hypothetical protein